MSHQRTLRELFHGALKGMFFAERKILDALPKMANAAHSGELRAAFEKHEIESREHVIRLREVFRSVDHIRNKFGDASISLAKTLDSGIRERVHENPFGLPGKGKQP